LPATSTPRLASRFVSMYVNAIRKRTLDYGPDGRQAIRKLLDLGCTSAASFPSRRVEVVRRLQ
jgi:predicted solute-binding protein